MMHTEKHPIEIEFTIVDRIVEYSKLQARMSFSLDKTLR